MVTYRREPIVNTPLGTPGMEHTFSTRISSNGLFFAFTGRRSIAVSVSSAPSITRPNIVYLPYACQGSVKDVGRQSGEGKEAVPTIQVRLFPICNEELAAILV